MSESVAQTERAERDTETADEGAVSSAPLFAETANGEAQATPPRTRKDRPPRPRPKRPRGGSSRETLRGAALKASNRGLERSLAEILTFPAVPAMMFAPTPEGKAYLCEHFTRSGPRTATELVRASESSPQLREILERITTGGGLFTAVVALLAYGAPPVMWAIGMRAQAAALTQASTMTEADLAAMMAAANAAATDEAAAGAFATAGAEGEPASPSPTAPEPGSL